MFQFLPGLGHGENCFVLHILNFNALLLFTSSGIIGGIPDIANDLKYDVSIQIQKYGNFRHICSGSIIANNFVLSAAHCFISFDQKIFNPDINDYILMVGTNRLGFEPTFKSIKRIYIPKSYALGQSEADVAVIKVI